MKVTRAIMSLKTDRSTLPRLSSSLDMLIYYHHGLNFILSLYTKLLSQFARAYDNVAQEQWMVRGEIVNLTNDLVSLSMDG